MRRLTFIILLLSAGFLGARAIHAQGDGGYRLVRCGGLSRMRLLQVGDRTGHAILTSLRESVEGSHIHTFPK